MTEDELQVVRDGVSGICEALGDHFYCYEVGFTCSEAEGFYEALLALDLPGEAEHFMRHHAESDMPREGDLHRPVGDRGWERIDPAPDYPGDDEPRLTGHPPNPETEDL